MEIKDFLIKLIDSNWSVHKALDCDGYFALTPVRLGYNRLRYYIFKKPLTEKWFICSFKSNKEGRHILIENFSL